MIIYKLGVSILLEEVIVHYLPRLIIDIYKKPYSVVILSNNINTYTPYYTANSNRPRDGLILKQLVTHHVCNCLHKG